MNASIIHYFHAHNEPLTKYEEDISLLLLILEFRLDQSKPVKKIEKFQY